MKPDVVAPGTDILSTRSANARDTSFCGTHQHHQAYAYSGGTSMASPIVAGLALLVRQWYQQNGHSPSAALVKATLINGCRWLSSQDATSSNLLAPNYDQGFGVVHLPTTLPDDSDSPFKLRFVDTHSQPAMAFVSEQDRPIMARVDVGSRLPLRVCLTYTDPPGRASQNDLTLIVEKPDRSKVWGNSDRVKQFHGSDRDNTTEIVRIADPDPGTYLLSVVANNVLRAPQGFALVTTGDLDELHVTRH